MQPTRPATTAFAVTMAVLLAACGQPVLDTSSVPAFVESTRTIEESLEADQTAAFEDAFDYLTDGAEISADPKYLEPVIVACARLDGLTAEEIIRTAWEDRIAITETRVAELEALRDETAAARRVLQGVEIAGVQLFAAAPGFLDNAVVDIQLVNHTRHRLYEVAFEVSFRSRDEIEPWVVETVARPFGAGLAPGRDADVRLDLEDGAWNTIDRIADRGVLGCDVARIVGRRKHVIAASEYGDIDAYLLDALLTRLGDLRASPPQ